MAPVASAAELLHGATPAPSRKRAATNDSDAGHRSGTGRAAAAPARSPFDFLAMLEDDQAGAAADHASVLSDVTPAVVRGHGRGHATAPSTTTTTTGGRASSTNKTNTATSGSSTGSALSSARRSASSALSTSSPLTSLSERARPARTPRTDEAAASVDGDGPEEISELMTLITQRLNRKLDNKKRKLESMAEQALQQVQQALKEHVRTHCDALEQQQAEHQRKMDALYATAAEDTHLMRQLQANYVEAFSKLLAKSEATDKAIQEEEEHWLKTQEALNKARQQHMEALQAQLGENIKAASKFMRSVDEDQKEARQVSQQVQLLLNGF